jgi:hypothetical protein
MSDKMAVERGLARPGQRMVLLAGMPFGKSGVVNTVAIRTAGEFSAYDDHGRARGGGEASARDEGEVPHPASAGAWN